jgi:flagellar protein FliO/FliZ
MSALSGLSENKALLIGAAAIALFVAALLVLLVFRLAFGRRLRMSGGRGRQLRLGIVDAFDLDRQRQLVIVRRDNIEHLIMIGGPNDVLIEAEIVRAEARELREVRNRDKEARDKEIRGDRDKEFKEPPQIPPLKAPAAEPKLPLPPLMPEPQLPAAQEVAPPIRLQPVSRAPAPPAAAPVRRAPSPPDIKPLQAEPPSKVEPEPPTVVVPPNPPEAKPAPSAAPSFLRWPLRPGSAPKPASGAGAPPTPTSAPAATAAAAPSPVPPSDAPTEPAIPDAMESLEEEMAKLLGRSPNKP